MLASTAAFYDALLCLAVIVPAPCPPTRLQQFWHVFFCRVWRALRALRSWRLIHRTGRAVARCSFLPLHVRASEKQELKQGGWGEGRSSSGLLSGSLRYCMVALAKRMYATIISRWWWRCLLFSCLRTNTCGGDEGSRFRGWWLVFGVRWW